MNKFNIPALVRAKFLKLILTDHFTKSNFDRFCKTVVRKIISKYVFSAFLYSAIILSLT